MFNEPCKKITSAQNPLVAHWRCLRTSRDYREEKRSVLICGKKIVLELVAKIVPIAILSCEPICLPYPHYLLSEELMKKITGISEGMTVAAEFALPEPHSLTDKKFILALDSVADPGNVGTLIRSALSFYWEGLFLLGNCADPFNDKVLRAARGGSLLMPYYRGNLEALEALITLKKPLFIADLQGENIKKVPAVKGAILLLSNEAQGVQNRIKPLGQLITVAMNPVMESLNVATAGAILMHYLHE